ncbi:MAG: DUF1189 domain-containing protein [Clostridia bacterium]|nr:DUF1189 domain-containing protein [Clostridia bacterium]
METKSKDKKEMKFFQRVKKSIFELEDYGFFLGEKLSVAFKYLFLLTVLISFLVTCGVAYDMTKMLNKANNYIENEFPDFSFSNGILETTRYEEGYDEEFDFKIVVDTGNEISKEQEEQYRNKLYDASSGIILLRDKFIFSYEGSELENSYDSLTTINTETDPINLENEFKISNKQELVKTLEEFGILRIVVTYSIIIFIALVFVNLMFILSDVFVLTLLGLISARICGVNFKMDPMMTLSIYALTLPLILDTILDVVLITTGFSVPYFEAIRLLIAYIYVIAAIFMIKYDLLKQREELQKIIEVQKQVKAEMNEEKTLEENKEEENKDENKDNTEEKKEEKTEEDTQTSEENREPDGSEI